MASRLLMRLSATSYPEGFQRVIRRRQHTAGALTAGICLFGLTARVNAAAGNQAKTVAKAPHAPKPLVNWGPKPTDHPKLDRKLNNRAEKGASADSRGGL
jgi:hypothetical protein